MTFGVSVSMVSNNLRTVDMSLGTGKAKISIVQRQVSEADLQSGESRNGEQYTPKIQEGFFSATDSPTEASAISLERTSSRVFFFFSYSFMCIPSDVHFVGLRSSTSTAFRSIDVRMRPSAPVALPGHVLVASLKSLVLHAGQACTVTW